MTSVNFTASVDRDLLKRVKVLAAMNDTSVSALLNGELPMPRLSEPATAAMVAELEALPRH